MTEQSTGKNKKGDGGLNYKKKKKEEEICNEWQDALPPNINL